MKNPLRERKQPFELVKWYFDCVSSRGEVFIGYWGTLRWKSIQLHYQEVLVQGEGQKSQTRFSVKPGTPPERNDHQVRWNSAALHIDAVWEQQALPIQATIFESRDGAVEWSCVQPRARAQVRIGKQRLIEGLGYVEVLQLSVSPWNLPLKELRWGRFLSERDSVVWIDWRGSYERRLLFHNHRKVEGREVSDRQVVFNNHRLEFEKQRTLREEALSSKTVLRGLKRLFPLNALRVQEHKWVSESSLVDPSGSRERGWTIHEVVRWP